MFLAIRYKPPRMISAAQVSPVDPLIKPKASSCVFVVICSNLKADSGVAPVMASTVGVMNGKVRVELDSSPKRSARNEADQVVIATDADVDGMHIRLILLTFFLQFFPELVRGGHLFILQTPLFRVRNKKETRYCYDEDERVQALEELGKAAEITRFKGLGEMPPAQLKETTMNPASRRLLKVELPQRDSIGADLRRNTDQLVNTLMGKKAELRFGYIRDHAEDALANLDV